MESITELFGNNVKRLRKDRGLTQDALAKASQISLVFLQNIEAGRRWVGPETVGSLARALGVRATELFADPERAAPNPQEVLSAVSKALGISNRYSK